MTHEPTLANVMAVYLAASNDDREIGLSWYDVAHEFALFLDPSNVSRACGVVAAISANTSWTSNKSMATRAYLQGHGEGMGYKDKCEKVTAILAGASPLDVLGGNKVRAFYSTILNPHGDCTPVIDRHAYDIAIGRRLGIEKRDDLNRKGRYDIFAGIYREAARLGNIGGAQMQAITWVAWRNHHGITV